MAKLLKKSKRFGLIRLDNHWREKIFSSIKSERLKLAVATLSCTGCRPAELETGVVIRLRGGLLEFGLTGSKCDPATGRGQPLRLLRVAVDAPWSRYLADKIAGEYELAIRVTYDSAGVSQRLREKSRELWPRRKVLVSAYSYRHFLGKSLKESGLGVELIAATLGHATDFSQSVYGRAGRGKKTAGMHGIISAKASNPIRHSAKTDRLVRFKKITTAETPAVST